MKVDGCTILTHSGRYVDPLNLRPEDICLDDVAHALANQCRYSGHTVGFYSVGQHSVFVSRLLSGTGLELAGLLHDTSEYVLVDLPRPLKQAEGFQAYRDAEERAMVAVAEHFGLRWGFHHEAAVKAADLRMLATERRDLMPDNGEWAVLDGIEPLPVSLLAWPPRLAEAEFLARFDVLTKEAA